MEKPIQFIGRDMPEEISFGKWLRQRRRTLDLTQKALANQVGCAEITLRQIEADVLKPSKELAGILLKRLGIPEFERRGWIAFARGTSGYPPKTESRSARLEQKTNLPIALTSFVGRQNDVGRVIQRLANHRLVTLIGAGGIGKTRLAQQVGRHVLEDYKHGVWLIELASLYDPILLPQTVATVFGIQSRSDGPITEILVQVLRAKIALLILDNCEHLLDACAQLADKLLKHCPNLKILATSRETLGVIGEALYQVPSLTIPEIQRIDSVEKLNDYESVRLFDERAQLVQMDFALTTENAFSVAQICNRLDGIPLAIELAAARINTFQIEEILKQLNVCFSLLANDSRTELPRHRTLRASIDWSWGLLSEEEQIFLRQLSVFAGGWTLESAQAICEGNSLNLIGRLVKKSLIMIDQKFDGETRYHFHEIVRQYMHERLIKSGEEANIRTRHLNYFLGFSEQAELALKGPTQIEWFARLIDDHDNIRAALEWADKTDVEAGLYLSGRLYTFWEDLAVREGASWLNKFIEKSASQAYPLARAKALLTQGWLLQRLQQFPLAHSAAQECLKLFKFCNDKYGEIDALGLLAATLDSTQAKILLNQALSLAQALNDRWRQADITGKMSWFDNEYQLRRSYREEAIKLFRELGDWHSLALYLAHLADQEMLNGDLDSAQKSLAEAMKLNKRLNNKALQGEFLSYIGRMAFIREDYERARINLQEATRIAEELGNRMHHVWGLTHLGYVALRESNIPEARNLLAEAIQSFQKDKSESGVAFALEGMAGFYVAVGQPKVAARLIGWADAIREKIPDTRPLIEQKDVDKIIAACLEKMGEVAFSDAYNEGQKMTLDEAVAYALEGLNS
jgi:predicted ATPase/DNA-binding XRE family transcriptional regulator/predicted translin family RNA/ssDNA-binding protein